MQKNQIIFPDYNNSILNFSCSILNHFGAKVHHNTLPYVDSILEKNFKNVVVILLDGLGINILEKHLKPNDFLRKHFLCEYSSVFPPTTTASTTTMMSGLSPIEHGWLGWDVYFEQEDKIVTCFKNTLAGTTTPAAEYNIAYKYLPYKNLEQIINQTQNADAKILFPWIIAKPFDLDCWINEIKNRCNSNKKTFTYAYWEQPDGFLHAEGSDSQNVHNAIEELNKKIESLCADLTDTVVFITADHGHIDIQMDFFEENYPDFTKMLERPVSIEQRGISFYVKDEFIPVFKERFLELFGSDYLIFSKEEVFQNKLFGPGVPNKNLTGIGDFLAPAIGTRTMFWNKKFPQFKSHHAGLTSQEMKIPLIVVKKKEKKFMDSFVTETDFNLLQNDKYTFFVLARILHGNCNFVLSNHKNFIICHSCEPFPLWIWTSDDISQSEKEEIYKILDKNSFLNGKYTFNLKYDFAEFLINRAKTENKTLSIHKNMFAYDCPSPIEPAPDQKADGTFSKATIADLEDFIDLWDWFHSELKIDMKTREEYCKDAEYSLKNDNVFLWKNSQGKIVACCRYNVNGTIASIGLVYTHPDFRRKHYAQNLVYQVAKIISDQGLTPMLYTDADYIASNSCYEKIGFILRGKLCTLR